MRRSLAWPLLAAACAAGTMTLAAACSNSSDKPTDNTPAAQDSGGAIDSAAPAPSQDTGVTVLPDGNVVVNDSAVPPPPDCFTNPTTHFEIINACTTAQKVDKHPNLPLLLPDGGLPPPL